MDYWLGVLGAQIPTVVEKAMASEGATSGAPFPPPGRPRMLGLKQVLTGNHHALVANAWAAVQSSTCAASSSRETMHSTVWAEQCAGAQQLRHAYTLCIYKNQAVGHMRHRLAAASQRMHAACLLHNIKRPACLSQSRRAGARRRASAFGRALAAHLAKIRSEPGAYGQLGLSDLFEMREECLREFGFADVYRCDLHVLGSHSAP